MVRNLRDQVRGFKCALRTRWKDGESDSTEVSKSSGDDEVRRQTWARKVGIPREFSKITLGKYERSYNISLFHFIALENFYPTLYLPKPLVRAKFRTIC